MQAQTTDNAPKGTAFRIGNAFIYTVLIIGAIIALVPFAYTVSVSLMNLTESLSGQLLPSVLRWDNYRQAWQQANFALYMSNSVKITILVVCGELVFSTLAAYTFACMEFPGKSFLFSLLLVTLMLPEAVIWIPNYITVSWLGRLGPIPWLNNWPALTIPFMASTFSIFLLRQFFQQVPLELWDAAQIDGAGHLRYLIQVMVPLSRAALMTIVLFAFIASWNSLAWPILVTTTPDWRPVSYGLLSFINDQRAQFHLQMAGAIITMLPILVNFFYTQRTFIEGIANTGLKG
jgi:ABC-type glycerol-3-phosphate transport system permease component